MTSTDRDRGIGLALLAAVVSGGAVFVNGIAVREFDDATVYTMAKNLVAGALLAGVFVVTHRARRATAPPRSQWGALALIAVVGGAVPFVLFFEGLARATSSDAAFIHKTLVIWVAIAASIVLGERVTWAHAGAIGLLLLGHIALDGGPPTSGLSVAGVLVLAATLLWATEVILVKRVLAVVDADVGAIARMGGGSLLLVLWVTVTGDLASVADFTSGQWAWLAATGATLAVFVTVWYSALSLAGAIDVSAVLVLGSVITGVLNVGVRGFPVPAGWWGYVLIAVGAAAVVRQMSTRTAPTGHET